MSDSHCSLILAQIVLEESLLDRYFYFALTVSHDTIAEKGVNNENTFKEKRQRCEGLFILPSDGGVLFLLILPIILSSCYQNPYLIIPPSVLFPYTDDETLVSVSFEKNTDDSVDNMPSMMNISKGDILAEPEKQPIRDGYEFTGWFLDSACATVYGFDKPVDSNLVLYAGWTVKLPTVTFRAVDMTGTDFKPAQEQLSWPHFLPRQTDYLESVYTIDIWYYGGEWRQVGEWSYSYDTYNPVKFPINVTEDITLYALCIYTSITEENSGINLPEGIKLQAQTDLLNYIITKDGSGTGTTQTEITLPGKVNGYPIVFIQDTTFENNESIQKVIFETGLEQIKMQVFNNCTSLSEVILPDTLKQIGFFAFNDTGLKSIKIPASVKEIDAQAFNFAIADDGDGLTEIIFDGSIPPSITGNSVSKGQGCTAYVPDEAVSAYMASGWADLIGSFKPISERQ